MKKTYNIINNGFIECNGLYKSEYGDSDTPLLSVKKNINLDTYNPVVVYDIELNLLRTLFEFITKYSDIDPIFVFKNNSIFIYFCNEQFDIYIRLQNSWGMYDYIKLLKYKNDIFFSIDKFSIFSTFSFFLEHRNGKFKDIRVQINEHKIKISINEFDLILHNTFNFQYNHNLVIPEYSYTDVRFTDIDKVLPDDFINFLMFFQQTYFNSADKFMYHKTSSYEFLIFKK